MFGSEFKYNKDFETRDRIVGRECEFPYGKEWCGGIVHFSHMNVDTLKKLLSMRFADPDERQNACPSISHICEFMEAHPEFTAHGYIVTIDRCDYRVSIEGVEAKSTDMSRDEFLRTFSRADDLIYDEDRIYCRYT